MKKEKKYQTDLSENQQRSGSIDLEKDGKGESTALGSKPGISRRTVLKSALATVVGGAAALSLSPVKAAAANGAPLAGAKVLPKFEIKDYTKIPQRSHKYPASDRAKKIVHDSMTIDTLFSALWPSQWSSPEAPEFHDEMDQCKAAGFKVLAACPSADSLDASIEGIIKGMEFYLKKMNERPDNYMIVRTTKDIDEAVKQNKLGIYFTHQGTQIFGGDVDRVAFWRELGYGYCLLAYNQRNDVGDGCFEAENKGLTAYGKKLVDAYNKYGMPVDVSHTGDRTSLDAIERSSQPVISSHSGAMAMAKYPRSLTDEVIKGIAQSGGVCSINMVGAFMDTSNPDIVTTDMLFRHIDYMTNLVGIDHVGFGSDYIPNINFTASIIQTPMGQAVFPDGGYTTKVGAKGFPTPAPYQIVAALVDKMLENGYSEEDCGKFLGGNMYRVFKQVWI